VLPGVVLHYAEIAKDDQAWFGTVPITTPLRSLKDCIEAHFAPDLIEQAIETGIARGLFTAKMVATIIGKNPIGGRGR